MSRSKEAVGQSLVSRSGETSDSDGRALVPHL